MTNEIIICAAIRVDGYIWRGHRHGHALQAMNDEMLWEHSRHEITGMNKEEGFITSLNRFVGRQEARKIFEAGGFKSVDKDGFRGDILFSEDLYQYNQ